MNPKQRPGDPVPKLEAPAPRKRFRIQKLEERIAPKKGGKGTHHSSGSSITIGTYTCSYY